MTRAELDAVLATRRAKLVQAREGTKASPATAPVAPRPAPSPKSAQADFGGVSAAARKPVPTARPPERYLAGEQEFKRWVTPDGGVIGGDLTWGGVTWDNYRR